MGKGLIFVIGVVLVICLGFVVSSVMYRNTEPYQIMKEKILSDPQVEAVFGREITFGFIVTGRFSEVPVKGTRYKFSISGANRKGKVDAWTKHLKDDAGWEEPTILITIDEDRTIKL